MFVRRDLTNSVPTREGNMHFVKQGSGYPLVMLHPLGTSVWASHRQSKLTEGGPVVRITEKPLTFVEF